MLAVLWRVLILWLSLALFGACGASHPQNQSTPPTPRQLVGQGERYWCDVRPGQLEIGDSLVGLIALRTLDERSAWISPEGYRATDRLFLVRYPDESALWFGVGGSADAVVRDAGLRMLPLESWSDGPPFRAGLIRGVRLNIGGVEDSTWFATEGADRPAYSEVGQLPESNDLFRCDFNQPLELPPESPLGLVLAGVTRYRVGLQAEPNLTVRLTLWGEFPSTVVANLEAFSVRVLGSDLGGVLGLRGAPVLVQRGNGQGDEQVDVLVELSQEQVGRVADFLGSSDMTNGS